MKQSCAEEEKEFLKGPDLSQAYNIERAKCQAINQKVNSIEFMQIDVDYYTAVPPRKFKIIF
jgi:hypothetical protein